MANFTLENLRAAADKKYAPTVIEAGDEEFVLPAILRMGAESRSRITDLLTDAERLAEDESVENLDEQIKTFSELISAAVLDDKGDRLLELIGDDTVILIDIVSAWMKDTQAGEA